MHAFIHICMLLNLNKCVSSCVLFQTCMHLFACTEHIWKMSLFFVHILKVNEFLCCLDLSLLLFSPEVIQVWNDMMSNFLLLGQFPLSVTKQESLSIVYIQWPLKFFATQVAHKNELITRSNIKLFTNYGDLLPFNCLGSVRLFNFFQSSFLCIPIVHLFVQKIQ